MNCSAAFAGRFLARTSKCPRRNFPTTTSAPTTRYAKSATALGLDPGGNVFSRLGVKTVINCRGTWTYLSGSLQFPEVRTLAACDRNHARNEG